MKSLFFLAFLISTTLIVEDAEAVNWKFWKSSSTEVPVTSTTTPGPTSKAPLTPRATAKVPLSVNSGLAGAADPGLSIGAGNVGGNVRDNARPQRPNPGTDVGLDLPRQKPSNSGYRDWAIDLTGAGEGRIPPRTPSPAPGSVNGQHPAGVPGLRNGATTQSPRPGVSNPRPGVPFEGPGFQPPGDSGSKLPGSVQTLGSGNGQGLVQAPRPGQAPGPVSGPGSVTPSPRPGSPNQGLMTPRPGAPNQQNPFPGSGYPSQTPRPGSPTSAPNFPGLPGVASGPGSAGKPLGGSQSPTGGKTFAQAAAGGSTTLRPTHQPGKPGISGAGAAAGVAAGAAGAGAAGAAVQRYSNNPTFSRGNSVTDEDLEKLSEALYLKDVNNAMRHITLNLQKQTTGSSPVDEAPQPLFNVKPEALQIPTIQKVLTIYDNYNLDTRTNEHINPSQRQEESLLVDTFLSTNVMAFAMRFLANKGFLKQDYYDYKDLLRTMWFNLFSRGDGKIGSTGFEHVFMTELKLGTEVSGLHNWIYFNAEEVKKRADYLGYIKKVDLGDKAAILKIHSKFNGIDKPVTTMFIGTSPELEMSLYTVCFVTRPDQPCPVSLGGKKFNIITHKFKYRGKEHVGSAYPDI